MPSFEEKLVRAVKRKREAEGLSIRALSSKTGVSFSTLARLERREGHPDNNSKIRLLQWLGQDADEAGLSFDRVAYVHFRAGKNIQSATVRSLLRIADCIRQSEGAADVAWKGPETSDEGRPAHLRSKEELEELAQRLRADLGLSSDEALNSLRVRIEGVEVTPISKSACVDERTLDSLNKSSSEWSAMSIPLDPTNERWVVLLNDSHTVERQRVTVLEELWHILLGHKLTKIGRIAESYGRTYDTTEEHDAYYLASATLLPKASIIEAVAKNQPSQEIATKLGTSPELVEYRIKRLGLWRQFSGKQIRLSDD